MHVRYGPGLASINTLIFVLTRLKSHMELLEKVRSDLTLSEISGAFGDLGTFLPLLVRSDLPVRCAASVCGRSKLEANSQ